MAKFEISNQHSGLVLGVFEGATEQEALDAMARDAGYSDYAELQREVPAQPGEIIVREVTPFTITNDETGASFEFPSEAAYEAALDWYNATDKEAVIAFCRARGVDLVELTNDPYYADGRRLVDDWADRAMHCYATSEAR